MPLIVEDGTGKADADSFVSLADWKVYQDALGRDYSSYADPEIEPAIRRGTNHVSADYTYKGDEVKPREQALSWPRTGATDGDGIALPSDEVPREVVQATNEAGWLELNTPGVFDPAYVAADKVTSEQVGDLAVTYAYSANDATSAVPRSVRIGGVLAPLTEVTGSRLSALAVRA